MPHVELDRLTKRFGAAEVISDLSLAVEAGEFCVLRRALRLRQVHAAAHDRRAGGRSPPARSSSTAATSPTCARRPSAISRWCSSPTRSIRT